MSLHLLNLDIFKSWLNPRVNNLTVDNDLTADTLTVNDITVTNLNITNNLTVGNELTTNNLVVDNDVTINNELTTNNLTVDNNLTAENIISNSIRFNGNKIQPMPSITQLTSPTTPITHDNNAGFINTQNQTLSALSSLTFTVNNIELDSVNDAIRASITNYTGTYGTMVSQKLK